MLEGSATCRCTASAHTHLAGQLEAQRAHWNALPLLNAHLVQRKVLAQSPHGGVLIMDLHQPRTRALNSSHIILVADLRFSNLPHLKCI